MGNQCGCDFGTEEEKAGESNCFQSWDYGKPGQKENIGNLYDDESAYVYNNELG